MPASQRGTFFLVLLYVGLVITILLRAYVEATHYCSPDSNFYLKTAENLLNHKGLVRPNNYPFSKSTGDVYFAVWPAGYPVLIAGLSFLTKLPVLVSSKLVNLLFLGFTFMLLHKWLGKIAWFPALYFCSFGMLEVYSYTWSESAFLFFVIWLGYILQQNHQQIFSPGKWQFLPLTLCLVGLFLFRYAGLVYFFLIFGFMLWYGLRKNYRLALHYFAALALSSTFVLAYLFYNYYQTGFYTGGARIFPEQESLSYFFEVLFKGLANQFFLARNYYFYGYTDYLFSALLLAQLVVCGLLIYNRKLLTKPTFDAKATTLLLLGGFYLVAIIVLRKLSPFDKFDYRILAPFGMPVFLALFYTVSRHPVFFRKTCKWVVAFMLLSLLMNLPKVYLLEKLTALF